MKSVQKYLTFFILIISIISCQNNQQSADQNSTKDSTSGNLNHHPELTHTDAIDKDFGDENDVKDKEVVGPIVEIKSNYQKIQKLVNDGNLELKTTTFKCDNDPGSGKIIRYFDGDELILIDYVFNSEHWWEKKRIYFENDVPFFAYEEEGTWSFGGPQRNDGTGNTIDKIKERRYYMKNGDLIRQLNKDYEIKSWEPKVNNNEIPNQSVTIEAGATYPRAKDLDNLRAGKYECS